MKAAKVHDVLIVLPPITLGDCWRTRLHMDLSPHVRLIGRSPEAIFAARHDLLEYEAQLPTSLPWPQDLPEAGHGDIADAEGAEQDEDE